MIIYGDIQVQKDSGSSDDEKGTKKTKTKGKEQKVKTTRKLKFRSDGNILCGTRFRHFPDEIDNDVSVFIEEFNKAVLNSYDGDKKAVTKAKKEEAKKVEKPVEVEEVEEVEVSEEENGVSVNELKSEIAEVLSDMDTPTKRKCAKIFQDTLEVVDYKKSDDEKALAKALEQIKELA